MIVVALVVALLLVVLGGLMAAADAAVNSLSRVEIQELAVGRRRPGALLAIAADPNAHVNAIGFVRILAETTAAVLVTISLDQLVDELWLALLLAALTMTAVSFVLVGASPRSVGRVHARTVLALSAPLVRGLRLVLGPVAGLLVGLGNLVTPGRPRGATFTSEEQLLSMVDEATELEVLERADRELIHSIFEWGDTLVREVMVPRTDMVTVDADTTLADAMRLYLERGISRAPVIGDDVDDVVGVLTLRDMARVQFDGRKQMRSATAGASARPPVFVPESRKADDALRSMQLESNHIALVVDEYGGIAGLVTMEDLIEELVGEISDEYDRARPGIEDLGGGRYRVSSRLHIEELGDLFGLELEDDEVDSVGGLLTKALGALPQRGRTATAQGLRLAVDAMEGRRRLVSVIVDRDPAAIVADSTDDRGAEEPRR